MVYLRKQRIRDYLEMQRVVTAIWEKRGIKWEDVQQPQTMPPAQPQQKQSIRQLKVLPAQLKPAQPKPAQPPETHKQQTGIDWEQINKCEIKQTIPQHSWQQELIALQHYFKSTTMPKTPITIDKGQTIMDVNKFITNNLITAKANNGNATFIPYISRLRALETCCKNC